MPRVLITVCTYGRPDGLRRLLRSLEVEVDATADVLVIDNNPARNVLASIQDEFSWARFTREPEPGIPAARNRALAHAGTYWALLFVDDDEYVVPGWLEAHVSYARKSDAVAFFAPVISEYMSGADPRVVRGGILDRERRETGTRVPFGATNNTLLKVAALSHDDRFDPAYTESGGSDVHFFAALARRGHALVWNDEPVVHELVPAERATISWVQRRYRRMGNNLASLNSQTPRWRLAASAVARIATGLAGMPVEWISARVLRAGTGRLWMGIGMLDAVRGKSHVEYVRSESVNVLS